MNRPRTIALVKKLVAVAAVVVIGFLCGWSATGVTGGVVTAVALGAGVSVAIFFADTRPSRPSGRSGT